MKRVILSSKVENNNVSIFDSVKEQKLRTHKSEEFLTNKYYIYFSAVCE